LHPKELAMLSKNKQKFITGLQQKKQREKQQLFMAEGHKLVMDFIASDNQPVMIVATQDWLNDYSRLISSGELIEATYQEIKSISLLKTPPPVIALIPIPEEKEIIEPSHQMVLALDDIQDPGNLGTIIRLADWFGIKQIIASNGTADCYNPKVVQASMGAIARVSVSYTNLIDCIINYNQNKLPVYGTFLEGKNIYTEKLSPNGLVVLGNEGNGISQQIAALIPNKLLIPNFSEGPTSESLNVSTAAAIICSEFKRRTL
jgi:TrmH family RNA methyltransferase